MEIESFDPQTLTQEKSLFAIYTALRKEVKEQPFNVGLGLAWSLLMAVNIGWSKSGASETATLARSLADSGVNFAASILGFLLAGFTIFATLSKSDLLLNLATITKEKGGLSYLKLNYFALIEVFIDYVVFVVFCLAVKIACVPNSGISIFLDEISSEHKVKSFLAKVVLWMLSSGFLWIVLKLKSFIFNVYHIVMTGIRWDAENKLS